MERHDITIVLEVSKMFEEQYGPEAAREHMQHLADDLKGKFGHLVDNVEKMVNSYLDYFGVLPKGK